MEEWEGDDIFFLILCKIFWYWTLNTISVALNKPPNQTYFQIYTICKEVGILGYRHADTSSYEHYIGLQIKTLFTQLQRISTDRQQHTSMCVLGISTGFGSKCNTTNNEITSPWWKTGCLSTNYWKEASIILRKSIFARKIKLFAIFWFLMLPIVTWKKCVSSNMQ